jgi:hypothetical protein
MPCSACSLLQIKLGRRDARLLIDVTTVAHQHARSYLPGQLTAEIDQLLGQLRLGQVSAEGHAHKQGEPEENDLDRVPAPPAAGPAWEASCTPGRHTERCLTWPGISRIRRLLPHARIAAWA